MEIAWKGHPRWSVIPQARKGMDIRVTTLHLMGAFPGILLVGGKKRIRSSYNQKTWWSKLNVLICTCFSRQMSYSAPETPSNEFQLPQVCPRVFYLSQSLLVVQKYFNCHMGKCTSAGRVGSCYQAGHRFHFITGPFLRPKRVFIKSGLISQNSFWWWWKLHHKALFGDDENSITMSFRWWWKLQPLPFANALV